jgi:hypothetical protein
MRAFAVAVAVVIGAGTSAAQPGPQPAPEPGPPAAGDEQPWSRGVSADAMDAAEAEFKIGNVEFTKKRYTDALQAFERALGHWANNPQIQFNAALCLMHLGRPLEAHERLTRALAYGPQGFESDALFDTALLHQKNLRAQLVELTVTVDEAGASVTIDGDVLQPGTARLLVAGRHQLVASKPGFVTQTKTLELPGGAAEQLTIDLEPPPAPIVRRRWASWLPWTIAGSGLVVASVGAVFHVRSLGHFDDYADQVARVCPSGCRDSMLSSSVVGLRNKAELERAVAISAYVLGGAAIATGVVMAVINRSEVVDEPGTQVIATFGDSLGVAVRGGF